MWRAHGRPVGLWLLVGLIVIEGVALFASAFDMVVSAPPGSWPTGAISSAVIGGLLLRRARGLWDFQRAAWQMVALMIVLASIGQAIEIALGHGRATTWVSLGWAVATLLYLGHPAIRALFVDPHGADPG